MQLNKPSLTVLAAVIDAAGRLLTPGFIDAHVHMSSVLVPDQAADADPKYVAALEFKGAEAALMRGFTTQRDTGGNIWGLKRAIDEGLVPGPRVYLAGAAISQTGGHDDGRNYNDVHKRLGGPLSGDELRGDAVIADGVPEVLAAVREQLRKGASFIKLMASGGAGSEYDPLDVSEYTMDELRAAVEVATSFGTYVTVHSYNSTSTRRAVEAGVRCIEHGHLIDAATMHLLVERDVFLSTNLVVYETASPGSTPRQIAKFAEVHAAIEPMMKLARASHVKAELLARSGPRNPYPGVLGVTTEGAYADLLLIDGDPLKDLSVLEHPDNALALIMKDGRVYKDRVHVH